MPDNPITYQIPRDVYGDELFQIHEKALEMMRSNNWQGAAEKQESGNYRLFAVHSRERSFPFVTLKLFDIFLATIDEIDPQKKYRTGEQIAFRASDVTAIAPMGNVRWIEDADNPIFKKLEPLFLEYTRSLNAVFNG